MTKRNGFKKVSGSKGSSFDSSHSMRGGNGGVNRPAGSPDLNPMDVFLGGGDMLNQEYTAIITKTTSRVQK